MRSPAALAPGTEAERKPLLTVLASAVVLELEFGEGRGAVDHRALASTTEPTARPSGSAKPSGIVKVMELPAPSPSPVWVVIDPLSRAVTVPCCESASDPRGLEEGWPLRGRREKRAR